MYNFNLKLWVCTNQLFEPRNFDEIRTSSNDDENFLYQDFLILTKNNNCPSFNVIIRQGKMKLTKRRKDVKIKILRNVKSGFEIFCNLEQINQT